MPVYLFQHTRESARQDSNRRVQLTDHCSAFQNGPSASAFEARPCARADATSETVSVATGRTGITAARRAWEASFAATATDASSADSSPFSRGSDRRAMLSSFPPLA